MDESPLDSAKSSAFRLASIVLVIGVLLDQATKALAYAHLRGGRQQELFEGFFELRYAQNPGAFFSLGGELPMVLRQSLFVGATIVATFLIIKLYRRATPEQRALRWGLVGLLAGAFGNVIDRLLRGEVIDFFHFHVRDSFDWATFNVADIYIVLGLVLLSADLLSGRPVASTSTQGI